MFKYVWQLSCKAKANLRAVFTKLASQLTSDKLADLAVIPVIYAVQVAISYVCSLVIAKAFGFDKRARNFVIAMGVGVNAW